MHAGSKHSTFTAAVPLHPALPAARATSERDLGVSLQLFSARGINRSSRFCSLGSGY